MTADAMAIAGPAMADFTRIQKADGVRAAVEDRDASFLTYRTYWDAYQASKAKDSGPGDGAGG